MLARRRFLRNANPHLQGGNVPDRDEEQQPGDRPERPLRGATGPSRRALIITRAGCLPNRAMTVNLTRIYTRLGDDGETHLGDMSRVSSCTRAWRLTARSMS